MTVPVQEQLHAFATTLLERRGALVDWPAADRAGTAILPADVAADVGSADDVVPVACEAAGSGLSVTLTGDFLEWAGRLLGGVPNIGNFRVRDMYLKRKELDEGVRRAFTWTNAKVTFREGRETTAEYHTWWFHGVPVNRERCPGEGIRRSEGALAASWTDEDDCILAEIHEGRKHANRREIPEGASCSTRTSARRI